jgi:hypothetical protein
MSSVPWSIPVTCLPPLHVIVYIYSWHLNRLENRLPFGGIVQPILVYGDRVE